MLSPELLAEEKRLRSKFISAARRYSAALKASEAGALTIGGRVEVLWIVKAIKLEYNAARAALTSFRKAHPGR